MSDRSSPRRSPQASINQAFDEENTEDLDQNGLKTSSPSTSDSKSHSNRVKALKKSNEQSVCQEMSTMSSGVKADQSPRRHDPPPAADTSTPNNKCRNGGPSPKNTHKPVNKMSSEESLLSGAGSLVIEESASSGGESSPGSGIYKNIIINLGGLAADINDLSLDSCDMTADRLSRDKKVNNIGSTERTGSAHQSPDIRTQTQQKWCYFCVYLFIESLVHQIIINKSLTSIAQKCRHFTSLYSLLHHWTQNGQQWSHTPPHDSCSDLVLGLDSRLQSWFFFVVAAFSKQSSKLIRHQWISFGFKVVLIALISWAVNLD